MSDTDQPQPAKPKITPISVLSLGSTSLLTLRVEHPDGRVGHYVSPRQVLAPGEQGDPTLTPLSQIPTLIALLKELVSPSMTLRKFENAAVPVPATKPKTRATKKRGSRR